MMRIDEIWLATEPLDMRAGPDKALARVIQVFGLARPHCAYLFANKRGNRMKVLIHDGLGIWLCARRLNRGKFHWGEAWRGDQVRLTEEQLSALVQGLPWQRLGAGPFQLAVRGITAQWSACCGSDDTDPVSQAERA